MRYIHTREFPSVFRRTKSWYRTWMNLKDEPDTKGQILCDAAYMWLDAQREKGGGWLPGVRGEGMRSYCLVGTEFQFGTLSSGRE